MTRIWRRSWPALLVASLLLLAGCGSSQPDLVREPYAVDDPLPNVETSDMRLPASFEDLEVVDPGWVLPAQYADGVYLSAAERDGVLEFSAVDVHGQVLWAAQRPATCTAFTVTTDARGRSLAVLGDRQSTDDAPVTASASAYDMRTGERAWGPVEVPGPQHGPGLVFAAPDDGGRGDTAPRLALDPTTGDVAADESTQAEVRIVGEYHGVLLLVQQDALVARDLADDRDLWRLPLTDQGWTAASITASPHGVAEHGLALIDTSDSSGALIDLRQGVVVDDTARDAAVDPATGTLVVQDDQGLQAYDADRQPLWSPPLPTSTTIAATGSVLLYLREDEAVRVHNVVTGDVAQAYAAEGQGRIIVPFHITVDGATILLDGERQLLATVPEQPVPQHPVPGDPQP